MDRTSTLLLPCTRYPMGGRLEEDLQGLEPLPLVDATYRGGMAAENGPRPQGTIVPQSSSFGTRAVRIYHPNWLSPETERHVSDARVRVGKYPPQSQRWGHCSIVRQYLMCAEPRMSTSHASHKYVPRLCLQTPLHGWGSQRLSTLRSDKQGSPVDLHKTRARVATAM